MKELDRFVFKLPSKDGTYLSKRIVKGDYKRAKCDWPVSRTGCI